MNTNTNTLYKPFGNLAKEHSIIVFIKLWMQWIVVEILVYLGGLDALECLCDFGRIALVNDPI